MKRRALLASAALAVPVAGCATRSDRTTIPPDAVQRRIELESVGTVPDRFGFGIDATVTDPEVTGESSANVAVSVGVGDRDRYLDVGEDVRCALFNRASGRSTDEALWLQPPTKPGMVCPEGAFHSGPRWRLACEGDKGPVMLSYGCPTARRVEAGGTVETEYVLWDGPAEGYMPPGVHRFERDIEVKESRDGTTLGTVEWGFDLRVSDPGEV